MHAAIRAVGVLLGLAAGLALAWAMPVAGQTHWVAGLPTTYGEGEPTLRVSNLQGLPGSARVYSADGALLADLALAGHETRTWSAPGAFGPLGPMFVPHDEVARHATYRVETSVPANVVYQNVAALAGGGATRVLPADQLGTQYRLMEALRPPASHYGSEAGAKHFAVVVATQDHTLVAWTDVPEPPPFFELPRSRLLQAGDAWLLTSDMPLPATVTASAPVALFEGVAHHWFGHQAKDLVQEQLLPMDRWSNVHVVCGVADPHPDSEFTWPFPFDRVRIVPLQPGATVHIVPPPPHELRTHQDLTGLGASVLEFDTPFDHVITSDVPMMVGIFRGDETPFWYSPPTEPDPGPGWVVLHGHASPVGLHQPVVPDGMAGRLLVAGSVADPAPTVDGQPVALAPIAGTPYGCAEVEAAAGRHVVNGTAIGVTVQARGAWQSVWYDDGQTPGGTVPPPAVPSGQGTQGTEPPASPAAARREPAKNGTTTSMPAGPGPWDAPPPRPDAQRMDEPADGAVAAPDGPATPAGRAAEDAAVSRRVVVAAAWGSALLGAMTLLLLALARRRRRAGPHQ